jgi:hypothetical protein
MARLMSGFETAETHDNTGSHYAEQPTFDAQANIDHGLYDITAEDDGPPGAYDEQEAPTAGTDRPNILSETVEMSATEEAAEPDQPHDDDQPTDKDEAPGAADTVKEPDVSDFSDDYWAKTERSGEGSIGGLMDSGMPDGGWAPYYDYVVGGATPETDRVLRSLVTREERPSGL